MCGAGNFNPGSARSSPAVEDRVPRWPLAFADRFSEARSVKSPAPPTLPAPVAALVCLRGPGWPSNPRHQHSGVSKLPRFPLVSTRCGRLLTPNEAETRCSDSVDHYTPAARPPLRRRGVVRRTLTFRLGGPLHLCPTVLQYIVPEPAAVGGAFANRQDRITRRRAHAIGS